MLVLSRRDTETIRIGSNIEVHVIEIRSGRVRLGIQAPGEDSIVWSRFALPQMGDVNDGILEADMNISAVPARPTSLR